MPVTASCSTPNMPATKRRSNASLLGMSTYRTGAPTRPEGSALMGGPSGSSPNQRPPLRDDAVSQHAFHRLRYGFQVVRVSRSLRSQSSRYGNSVSSQPVSSAGPEPLW